MKKIGLLCLALVLALGTIGVGYAMWFDTVTIEGTVDTASLTMGFQELNVWEDPEVEGKDVGSINGYLDVEKGSHWVTDPHDGHNEPIYDKIVISINNAYPCYWGHITFVVANGGTIPFVITGLKLADPTGELNFMWQTPPPASPAYGLFWKDLNGNGVYDPPVQGGDPGELIIWVKYVDNIGKQLEPCDEAKSELDLHVEQAAEQNHTYTFVATIKAVQWNEYPLP
ncbi:MAG: hypothetical protein J7L92_04475 [Dehalococcoidia bacterium]|nr:hypothetical protein [Dehalococcoidia bacterium]